MLLLKELLLLLLLLEKLLLLVLRVETRRLRLRVHPWRGVALLLPPARLVFLLLLHNLLPLGKHAAHRWYPG